MKTLQEIKNYATDKHNETNHFYDNKPYWTHLIMVEEIAERFIDIIPSSEQNIIRAACWTHDLIEDCRETYNDVYKATKSERVAEITYALTNEKGKNRHERANDKYYDGINDVPFATFVKICDRIANVTYSKEMKSDMFFKYRGENYEFKSKLYHPMYNDMFYELDKLFE